MGLFGNKEEKQKIANEKKWLAKEKQEEIDKKADLKSKNKKSTLKLLASAKEHLDTNEEVLDYVTGLFKATILGSDSIRTGLVIATDKRIMFYGKKTFGFTTEFMQYSKISSIERESQMTLDNLNFITTGNTIKLEMVQKYSATQLLNVINSKMSGDKEVTTIVNEASNKSVVDQIKEFKELLDMEIITQEEFDKKKTELLNI